MVGIIRIMGSEAKFVGTARTADLKPHSKSLPSQTCPKVHPLPFRIFLIKDNNLHNDLWILLLLLHPRRSVFCKEKIILCKVLISPSESSCL